MDTRTVGYIVWFGKAPGQYTDHVDAGFQWKYAVDGLADRTTYCFAVQAYDATGTRSALSREVCSRTSGPSGPDDTPAPPPSPPPDDDTNDATEIVLYASKARSMRGNWAAKTSTGAAGGRAMRSADHGWSTPDRPKAAPANAFDLTFDADAKTAYRVWVRLRAGGNSKWNDSIWVQFSGARVNGKPAYRLGTTRALLINLEQCPGCGTSGWGWHNTAYWLLQGTTLTFDRSGAQTIRIQTREDGIEIDQIVLSASRYKSAPPGPAIDDDTALPESAPTPSRAPYTGTPIAIPGHIDAAGFDHGDANIAYADTSPGNSGGALRATDVDRQASSEGGTTSDGRPLANG